MAEQLPYPNLNNIKINQVEMPDESICNRGPSRLLYNDKKLFDLLTNTTKIISGYGNTIKVNNGIASADIDYINKTLKVDPTTTNSDINITDLADVCIETLTDGILQYDSTSGCFVSHPTLPTINESPLSTYSFYNYEHIKYPANVSKLPVIESFTFDLSTTSISGRLQDINGIFIECSNFGKLEVDNSTTSNVISEWKVEYRLHNEWVTINAKSAFNEDDDGGNGATVIVPYDNSLNEGKITLRFNLFNNLDTYIVAGNNLNYFKIIGLNVKDEDKNIASEPFDLIKVIVPIGTKCKNGILTNKTIISNSIINNITTTDINSILPIKVNDQSTTTTLKIYGFHTINSPTVTDTGILSNMTGLIGEADITINWQTSRVTGFINFFINGNINNQGAGVFDMEFNPAGDTIVCDSYAGNYAGSKIRFAFEVKYNTILSLPIFVDSNTSLVLTPDITYDISSTTVRNSSFNNDSFNTTSCIHDTFGNVMEYINTDVISVSADIGQNKIYTINTACNITLPDDCNPYTQTFHFVKNTANTINIQYNFGKNVLSSNIMTGCESVKFQKVRTGTNLNTIAWVIQDIIGNWTNTIVSNANVNPCITLPLPPSPIVPPPCTGIWSEIVNGYRVANNTNVYKSGTGTYKRPDNDGNFVFPENHILYFYDLSPGTYRLYYVDGYYKFGKNQKFNQYGNSVTDYHKSGAKWKAILSDTLSTKYDHVVMKSGYDTWLEMGPKDIDISLAINTAFGTATGYTTAPLATTNEKDSYYEFTITSGNKNHLKIYHATVEWSGNDGQNFNWSVSLRKQC